MRKNKGTDINKDGQKVKWDCSKCNTRRLAKTNDFHLGQCQACNIDNNNMVWISEGRN